MEKYILPDYETKTIANLLLKEIAHLKKIATDIKSELYKADEHKFPKVGANFREKKQIRELIELKKETDNLKGIIKEISEKLVDNENWIILEP